MLEVLTSRIAESARISPAYSSPCSTVCAMQNKGPGWLEVPGQSSHCCHGKNLYQLLREKSPNFRHRNAYPSETWIKFVKLCKKKNYLERKKNKNLLADGLATDTAHQRWTCPAILELNPALLQWGQEAADPPAAGMLGTALQGGGMLQLVQVWILSESMGWLHFVCEGQGRFLLLRGL